MLNEQRIGFRTAIACSFRLPVRAEFLRRTDRSVFAAAAARRAAILSRKCRADPGECLGAMENRPYTRRSRSLRLVASRAADRSSALVRRAWASSRSSLRTHLELVRGPVSRSAPPWTCAASRLGRFRVFDLDAQDPATIRVRISVVDPKFPVVKGLYATLNHQGLSGNAYVELDFSGDAHEALVSSARSPARITAASLILGGTSGHG